MSITTRKQFTGGIESLKKASAKTRDLIQELLITATYYAESDGDAAPINRLVSAIAELKSFDMWKVHKWLIKYEAPVKPSEDGKSYVFDAKKRHLKHGDNRLSFIAYETVMRNEAPWYELAKAAPSPKDVWDAETKFESFAKTLEKHGFSEAATQVKALVTKLKNAGKLKTTTEMVLQSSEPAPV